MKISASSRKKIIFSNLSEQIKLLPQSPYQIRTALPAYMRTSSLSSLSFFAENHIGIFLQILTKHNYIVLSLFGNNA